MRYYNIIIKNPSGGRVWRPTGFEGLGGDSSFTSFLNNQTLPGAWQIELDIPTAPFALPMGGARVQVWGVALQDIAQAVNLSGYDISVGLGMSRGLPLATSAFDDGQRGVVVQGTIFQAFGNWVGTDMTLDLVLAPPLGPVDKRGTVANLSFDWTAGQKMSEALETTLSTAFPTYDREIKISDRLVLNYDYPSFQGTMGLLNQQLLDRSKSIIKDEGYLGVLINVTGKTIRVTDGSTRDGKVKAIRFQDLIGQPTWIEFNVVQLKCVMRGDLAVGDYITMPPASGGTQIPQTNTAQSFAMFRQQSDFQGQFFVREVRHVGSYRAPSADAWCTTINAVATTSQSVAA